MLSARIFADVRYRSPKRLHALSFGTFDIIILISLQIAMQLMLRIQGIPQVSYILVSTMIFMRLGQVGLAPVLSDALFRIGYALTLIILGNSLFATIFNYKEFAKSAAYLTTAILFFSASIIYFSYLEKLQVVRYLLRFYVIALIILLLLEIAEITFARGIFISLRTRLYGEEHLLQLQFEYYRDLTLVGFRRPMLLAKEPSYLALHIACNVLAVALLTKRTSIFPRQKYLLVLLFFTTAFLSGSPISLAAAAIATYILYSSSRVSILVFIITLSILIPYLPIDNLLPVQRFQKILVGEDLSAQNRLNSLKVGIEISRRYPFTGVGLGQDQALVAMLDSPTVYSDQLEFARLHNGVGVMLIFLGVPGLFLLWFLPKMALMRTHLKLTPLSYGIFVFFLFTGSSLGANFWVPISPIFVFSSRRKEPTTVPPKVQMEGRGPEVTEIRRAY